MQVRGLDLHVVDDGVGDPPLLLVHGYTGSDLDWADVQPALASSRRVVSYTHRGHGGSAHAPTYSLDDLVADLEAVVDQLGLAPMHLLGHSMGGVVVLRYALAHPEHVASLILMDTFAEPTGGMSREWIEDMKRKVRADGMGVMVELSRRYMKDARPEVLARLEQKLPLMDVEAFCQLGDALREYPSLVPRLGELSMPVTVLVGENDAGLVPPAHVMADTIPGAELVVLPGCGHSPQEDDPAAWLRAIGDHLERAVDG